MVNSIISVRDLRKAYGGPDNETVILKGLSFDVPQGQLTALIGPSGSGKSTLLSILGTLLKPTSGSIIMNGVEVTGMRETALSAFRNQSIGFVFQFHHLLPDFSAIENVMFPAAATYGYETSAMRARATMLLDRVGLADRRNYKATKLSGGQKQRVAIARALMNNPSVLLADEPTGNLDRESSAQVLDLLDAINRETGMTAIICTHSDEVAAHCKAQLKLVDGRLV